MSFRHESSIVHRAQVQSLFTLYNKHNNIHKHDHIRHTMSICFDPQSIYNIYDSCVFEIHNHVFYHTAQSSYLLAVLLSNSLEPSLEDLFIPHVGPLGAGHVPSPSFALQDTFPHFVSFSETRLFPRRKTRVLRTAFFTHLPITH